MHKAASADLLRTDQHIRNSKGEKINYPKNYNWYSHGSKLQDKVGRADYR